MDTAQLPPDIEIFRAGRHVDSGGVAHSFSADDIRAMAAGYDRAQREAPLTVGHPADDRPAYGWVGGLRATADGRLTMSARDVEPAFAELLRRRRFAKRSAAFYPPAHPNNPTPGQWYLRHVAFLGAQPPAVAGLKDIQFADEAGLVSFADATVDTDAPTEWVPDPQPEPEPEPASPPVETPMDLQQELEAARAELAAEKEKRGAAEAAVQAARAEALAARRAEQAEFCEALLKTAQLLPPDRAPALAALEAAANAAPVAFAEGQPPRSVEGWLRERLQALPPRVPLGEFAEPGRVPVAAPADDHELHARAQAWQTTHDVPYAQALRAVMAQGK